MCSVLYALCQGVHFVVGCGVTIIKRFSHNKFTFKPFIESINHNTLYIEILKM